MAFRTMKNDSIRIQTSINTCTLVQTPALRPATVCMHTSRLYIEVEVPVTIIFQNQILSPRDMNRKETLWVGTQNGVEVASQGTIPQHLIFDIRGGWCTSEGPYKDVRFKESKIVQHQFN